jgi:hypothetical protein
MLLLVNLSAGKQVIVIVPMRSAVDGEQEQTQQEDLRV